MIVDITSGAGSAMSWTYLVCEDIQFFTAEPNKGNGFTMLIYYRGRADPVQFNVNKTVLDTFRAAMVDFITKKPR